MADHENLPETSDYGRGPVLVAAVVGIVVAFLSVWLATGNAVFYEDLFRVGPTVEGGGIGADWVTGNTNPILDFAIALVHAADVIMGVFLVGMVLIHWAAFRRLASRMEGRTERETATEEATATDGGEPR